MQLSFRVADRREVVRVFFPAACAAALALMLVGCGGDGAAKFDSSLRDAPCGVVTAETVAGVFGLPVEEIEQHSAMGMCTYNWKGDGQVLDATIHVTRVSESAAAAAEYFGRATAGLSGAELDAAMNSIREQARKQAGEAGGTASNAWMAEVLPQREEQSIELARAALAAL